MRKRWVGLALLLLGSAVAVDGFLIEPSWIEVTRHTVQAPFAGPLKIAHLSDLHTYEVSRRERRLLALLEAEKPDLIVVTGDTLARSGSHEACRQLLSRLHAPLGVWLVRGNWENWRPVKGEHAFYASAGVHFLLNEARPVRRDVWIVGLDDPFTRRLTSTRSLAAARWRSRAIRTAARCAYRSSGRSGCPAVREDSSLVGMR